jgi:hypothetical protein
MTEITQITTSNVYHFTTNVYLIAWIIKCIESGDILYNVPRDCKSDFIRQYVGTSIDGIIFRKLNPVTPLVSLG